jgi:hypothetical protein
MVEDLAKELFGRTLKTALAKRICVSCRASVKKSFFESDKAYESYKEDGLCQSCQDDLK